MRKEKQKSPRPKFDFCFKPTTQLAAVSSPMITIKTENYNLISQDFYNKTIDSLDLNLISCTCGHSGCLIRYGSYKRKVQMKEEILTLTVVRVFCTACKRTHAILLSSMVPYSQIPLNVQITAIHAYILLKLTTALQSL